MILSDSPDVSSHETDHAWMLAAAQGDREAFGRLYDKYKHKILSYTHSIVGKEGVSEELAQEVFIKVYQYRDQYRADRSARFSTWLWTIARNVSIDYLRKKKEVLLARQEDDPVSPIDNFSSEIEDAEAVLLKKTKLRHLEECIEVLPPSQKEALSLRAFGGLDLDEITNVLNSTLPAVKCLIQRGKKSVIECVKGKQGDE